MDNNTKPRSRKDEIVLQEIDGEVLIYDLKVDKAFCLNKTSALVWQACDGKRTIAEINDFVGRELNARVDEDIVWLALDQLSRENLIESLKVSHPVANGVSRRDALRRIGLTSAIALPIITSLIAPMAIHANSQCVLGGACTCTAPNGGSGNQCVPTASTCNVNCVCRWANNGNNTGVCAP